MDKRTLVKKLYGMYKSLGDIRKWLADEGYTHIPYVNAKEDVGEVSNIFLPGPADLTTTPYLRSIFAKFKDMYGPGVMSGTGAAALLGDE